MWNLQAIRPLLVLNWRIGKGDKIIDANTYVTDNIRSIMNAERPGDFNAEFGKAYTSATGPSDNKPADKVFMSLLGS